MAIWQYRLTAVPEDAVRRRYDHLPTQLFIDHEGRRQARQHRSFTDEGDEPVFNDAYSTAWWDGLHIPATPVATQIDALLPRTTWGKPSPNYYSWKTNDEDGPDHDCYLQRNYRRAGVAGIPNRPAPAPAEHRLFGGYAHPLPRAAPAGI